MAICLRRVVACTRALTGGPSVSRVYAHASSVSGAVAGFALRRTELPLAFLFPASSRGFAKARKSKEDDDTGSVGVGPDIGPMVRSSASSQMEAAMVSLARELSKLRTGRATSGMLDHIMVESGDVKVPLNRVAVVSVIDAQTLSVMPYDPNTLKTVERALLSSPLGINPTPDGQRIVATISPLTKENIQALCKVITKTGEDVKQSIRRARQKALDMMKKGASTLPKDDLKRLEKEVEDLTKKFIKSTDDICRAKEKEISRS